MARKRRSPDDSQLGFTFEAPKPAQGAAELAGLDRRIAALVGKALGEDARSRHVIAAAMSELLDEPVTKLMLDAYASEAREGHNIPVHRGLALIAITQRFDLLDAALRRVGAAVLVGEEMVTAQLGHVDRQIAELKAKRRDLERRAKPIKRGDA